MSNVEWRKLGDIAKITIGEFVHRNKQHPDAPYPVYNGGIEPTGFYDNYNNNENKIVISARGATAGFVNRVFCKYWAGNSSYTIDVNQNISSWTYIYYYLKNYQNKLISDQQKGGGIPSISKKQVQEILIPVPAVTVQEHIVEILDTFTFSIENLKEQIALRRKQYEYYRDQLLDLEGKEGVEMRQLETIAEIGTGSSNTQDELEKGKYPFFVRSQIVRWKDEYEFDETAVITSGDGVGVGKVLHYYEGKYALHQRAYRIHIIVEDVIPKFLFYFMQKDFYNYIMSNAYAASVTSVRKPMLLKYPIPVPSLFEQQRIVDILDKFEESIQNLEAQLAQREKQYEYYRNKLLTFE